MAASARAVDKDEPKELKFPEGFLFGVATSAYQIEGGDEDDGRGENIWDYHIEQDPSIIQDGSDARVACDSYHKVQDDLAILEDMGVDFYRFSVSWTRILPTGYANEINQDGIRYYNELIDGLLARNIQPMITMFHWDLPKSLQDIGGLTNPFVADYFEDYARILFENFGDRVKLWLTFNINPVGYADDICPPYINQPGIGNYMYAYVCLLAHAKAYHLYDEQFRADQKGKIGLTIDGKWWEAGSTQDEEAAERARQLMIGLYANPIFGKNGDFPEVVRTRVAAQSKKENFPRSRLPSFTSDQINFIRGSADFLGLNIFTTFLVKGSQDAGQISAQNDLGFETYQDKNWPRAKSPWLRVVPWGLRKSLKWIKDSYDNPDIFITENGVSDSGGIQDDERIKFYKLHLSSLLEAIHEDKVNVRGYAAWSLMDNFEWIAGYTERFGLYAVDFDDPNRKRTPKASAGWYKALMKNRIMSSDEAFKKASN